MVCSQGRVPGQRCTIEPADRRENGASREGDTHCCGGNRWREQLNARIAGHGSTRAANVARLSLAATPTVRLILRRGQRSGISIKFD